MDDTSQYVQSIHLINIWVVSSSRLLTYYKWIRFLWTLVYNSLCKQVFSSLLGSYYLGVEWHGVSFNFLRNILFQSVCMVAPFHIPRVCDSFSLPMSSLTVGMVSLFNFSHSNRCAVVHHCVFDYIGLITNDYLPSSSLIQWGM